MQCVIELKQTLGVSQPLRRTLKAKGIKGRATEAQIKLAITEMIRDGTIDIPPENFVITLPVGATFDVTPPDPFADAGPVREIA